MDAFTAFEDVGQPTRPHRRFRRFGWFMDSGRRGQIDHRPLAYPLAAPSKLGVPGLARASGFNASLAG